MANILIIDDQPCVRQIISEELAGEGYLVTGVGDAESARAHLKDLPPDLVLLDLNLDGPHGWDVLRDLKRQDPSLPVLIVTAHDSFMDDPRLSEANGYLIKSVDFTELKKRLLVLLGGSWGLKAR
jgi:two-component system, response regulator, stage 0 sporulation protein F